LFQRFSLAVFVSPRSSSGIGFGRHSVGLLSLDEVHDFE
jgi:hypothetical protein